MNDNAFWHLDIWPRSQIIGNPYYLIEIKQYDILWLSDMVFMQSYILNNNLQNA